MKTTIRLEEVRIIQIDPRERLLTVETGFPKGAEKANLTFSVDKGALIATRSRSLVGLEDLKIGQKIKIWYTDGLDGTHIAKSVILENTINKG